MVRVEEALAHPVSTAWEAGWTFPFKVRQIPSSALDPDWLTTLDLGLLVFPYASVPVAATSRAAFTMRDFVDVCSVQLVRVDVSTSGRVPLCHQRVRTWRMDQRYLPRLE